MYLALVVLSKQNSNMFLENRIFVKMVQHFKICATFMNWYLFHIDQPINTVVLANF